MKKIDKKMKLKLNREVLENNLNNIVILVEIKVKTLNMQKGVV